MEVSGQTQPLELDEQKVCYGTEHIQTFLSRKKKSPNPDRN
jgi:hypothetical protein